MAGRELDDISSTGDGGGGLCGTKTKAITRIPIERLAGRRRNAVDGTHTRRRLPSRCARIGNQVPCPTSIVYIYRAVSAANKSKKKQSFFACSIVAAIRKKYARVVITVYTIYACVFRTKTTIGGEKLHIQGETRNRSIIERR